MGILCVCVSKLCLREEEEEARGGGGAGARNQKQEPTQRCGDVSQKSHRPRLPVKFHRSMVETSYNFHRIPLEIPWKFQRNTIETTGEGARRIEVSKKQKL